MISYQGRSLPSENDRDLKLQVCFWRWLPAIQTVVSVKGSFFQRVVAHCHTNILDHIQNANINKTLPLQIQTLTMLDRIKHSILDLCKEQNFTPSKYLLRPYSTTSKPAQTSWEGLYMTRLQKTNKWRRTVVLTIGVEMENSFFFQGDYLFDPPEALSQRNRQPCRLIRFHEVRSNLPCFVPRVAAGGTWEVVVIKTHFKIHIDAPWLKECVRSFLLRFISLLAVKHCFLFLKVDRTVGS